MDSREALEAILRHASQEGPRPTTTLREAAEHLGALPADSSENFLRRIAVERLLPLKDQSRFADALSALRERDHRTSCQAVPVGRPFHEFDAKEGTRTVVIHIAVSRKLD